MFKKKPQIKNLSPLRSSDRRKLADQIISDYRVVVPPSSLPSQTDGDVPVDAPGAAAAASPSPDAASGSRDAGNVSQDAVATQVTLGKIRSALLPEKVCSGRFSTTTGPNASPVSGIMYVGAHEGQGEDRILWFQLGKDNKSRLIPTVYTLWNPIVAQLNLLPLLHTPDSVVAEKLQNGADLMIPGLVRAGRNATGWDERAKAGAIIAVAGLQKAEGSVPAWVGECVVDVSNLAEDLRGHKGIAVSGLHWEGDELWGWNSSGNGRGKAAPESILEWTGAYAEPTHIDNTVTGDKTAEHEVTRKMEAAILDEDIEPEPSTQDVDRALQEAFIFALHKAKTGNPPPHHGIDFPIIPSFLVANMIQPNLRKQNQLHHYNIKKSSWKTAKKFIKHLDKGGLVKSKDRSGGETVIMQVNFQHNDVETFVPYKIEKPKAKDNAASNPDTHGNSTQTSEGLTDPSIGQKVTVKTLYRASSKLVPELVHSQTEFYTAQNISEALQSYVEARPHLGGEASPTVKLDAFITEKILGTNPGPNDPKFLSAGRILRGTLQKRVLEDTHLCIPYHIVSNRPSNKGQASATETEPQPSPKPKAGHAPRIEIVILKRGGNKTVTRIANLEAFFINPHTIAPELQKKCAGAASVGQLTGGKPGLMEVVVQGDQSKVLIRDVLAQRGVESRWVDVVDKTKKGGKGKGPG